jgi:large subunit ribosomal protein L4
MTLSLTVQTPGDEKAKGAEIELPAEIFDVPANIPLIHQVVVAQLAAARQGTHSTKTRADVRGGGKKPYRQKGTGRARQGSTRAPQFAGGGIVHGPHPRDYSQRTPKKMKVAALRGALSDRARNDRVYVVSSLVAGEAPSTKDASAMLAKVSGAKHVLVVAERTDGITWPSLRNVSAVHLIEPGQLNTYDVLVSDDVIFTQSALEAFIAGPVKGKATKGAATSAEADVPAEAEETEAAPAVDVAKPAKKTAPAKAAAKKAAPAAEAVDDEAADKLAKKAAASDAPAPKDSESPYGKGSHIALEDGSQPEGFPVKGNADSMLYHVPDSSFYDRTVAEVWFASAADAEKAGFELPPSQRDDADGSDN